MTRKVFGPASHKQRLVLQDNKTDVILVGGGAGGGKALRHGEKVLTLDGFINIEDIQIGDEVITPKGKIEKVSAVWPQGYVPIFKITFQDGRTIDCCGNHLWKFHLAGKGSSNSKVYNTIQLKEIVDKENNKEKGVRKHLPIIPLVEPIEFKNKVELPLSPYTLGALIGDGSFYGSPRLTGIDQFIFDRIINEGYNFGLPYYKNDETNLKSQSVLNIIPIVKELCLYEKSSSEKHIPEIYKTSSIEDRFTLVQGLMDTDGYVTKCGKTYFDTVSEKLAKDLSEVLFSLGFTVKITSKIGSYKSNGETVLCKKVFRLYIRGSNQKKLFSLPRKVARCKDKVVGNKIVSIEMCGKDKATCIAITGEDKLFVTTNYIVTHNSAICLMKNLDAIHDPNFRCTILRRTYPELSRAGGLIDESKKVYTEFNAIYKAQAKKWVFPSGAEVNFAAIATDDDLGGWQGSQLTRVLIDEAGDKWQENQVLFLLSRMRTADSSIHPQLIMTANPDANSFLKKWVDYCLDENGVPKEGTENIIRWFVVLESVVHWADTPQELYENYGKDRGLINTYGLSAEEVKKIDPKLLFIPKSFRFIPTNVFDNPYLLPPKNNSYLANLLAQPRVNQLKYLHGSWTAKAEGEGFWKREWIEIIDKPPTENIIKTVRAWDLASSEPSEAYPNPDWTAGVKMSRDRFGTYYIEDVVRIRKTTASVIDEIIKTAKIDGIDEVEVVVPRDPGQAGAQANLFLVRTLAEHGISVKSAKMVGASGKLNRFLPFAAISEAGAVKVVRGDWNEPYFAELENFIPNNRNQKDD